ncbi:hypothetical protein RDWZM_005012 [Blomia tropicalis]|uniref:Uncharacterized protein n=1 Tax=Blomia tropicalis TaxID=40697 RepID=A0A9Q0M8I8_BLOTA|nr:hypothetical protein RDWZM_005012 [Blomia tropicalis]
MTTKLFNVRLALMVLVLQLLLPSLNSQPNDVLSHEQAVAERGLLDFFLQNSWNDDESTVPLVRRRRCRGGRRGGRRGGGGGGGGGGDGGGGDGGGGDGGGGDGGDGGDD